MRGRAVVVAVVLAGVAAAVWLWRGAEPSPVPSESSGSAPAGSAAPPPATAGRGLAAATQTPRPAGDASAPSDAAVATGAADFRGIVVDERGAALAGVAVTPASDARARVAPTASGPDGRFGFATGEREFLEVWAQAPGRALRGMTATLEREKENRLVLVPACALRVRVLDDASGVPVEGAAVRLVTGTMVNGAFRNDLDSPYALEQTTDADGRTTLPGEGGLSNVLVLPKAHAPRLVAHVNVPPEGRDLEVRVLRGGIVEGRVLAPAGTSVAAAHVRLEAAPLYRRDVTTGADGRFRFEAVGGEERLWKEPGQAAATITASAAGFAHAEVDVEEPPKPGETKTIDVTLAVGRRVTGVVRTAEGSPAAGARIGLDWASDTEDASAGSKRAVADGEGRFALADLPPGSTELWVDDAQNRVHVRVTVGVPADADPSPVTVVLPDRRGRTTVRVLDAAGLPVAGAKVTAKAGPPVIDTVARGVTGADGSVALTGLPTDVATVQVLPPRSVLHAQEVGPDRLSGGEVVFRLEAGEVAGRAVRADGTPARVRLALDRDIGACREQGAEVATEADGAFRFTRLPKDSFELRVVDEGEVLVMLFPWARTGDTDLRVWVAHADEAARFHAEAMLVEAATDRPVPIESFSAEFSAVGGAGSHIQMQSSAGAGTTEVGRFVSFGPLPPGVYDATFVARGWRRGTVPGMRIPRDGPVPVLRLDRGARAEVLVLSTEGKPLEGVWVAVGPERAQQGGKTAADGTIVIEGLEVGEQPAKASGAFVLEDHRTVRVPAVGEGRIEWRLAGAGTIEVDLGDAPREPVSESVVATPLAGGAPRREEDDDALHFGNGMERRHGARFKGLAPGRWRVEVRTGTVTHPAQDVDVKPGEVTAVRLPE